MGPGPPLAPDNGRAIHVCGPAGRPVDARIKSSQCMTRSEAPVRIYA